MTPCRSSRSRPVADCQGGSRTSCTSKKSRAANRTRACARRVVRSRPRRASASALSYARRRCKASRLPRRRDAHHGDARDRPRRRATTRRAPRPRAAPRRRAGGRHRRVASRTVPGASARICAARPTSDPCGRDAAPRSSSSSSTTALRAASGRTVPIALSGAALTSLLSHAASLLPNAMPRSTSPPARVATSDLPQAAASDSHGATGAPATERWTLWARRPLVAACCMVVGAALIALPFLDSRLWPLAWFGLTPLFALAPRTGSARSAALVRLAHGLRGLRHRLPLGGDHDHSLRWLSARARAVLLLGARAVQRAAVRAGRAAACAGPVRPHRCCSRRRSGPRSSSPSRQCSPGASRTRSATWSGCCRAAISPGRSCCRS